VCPAASAIAARIGCSIGFTNLPVSKLASGLIGETIRATAFGLSVLSVFVKIVTWKSRSQRFLHRKVSAAIMYVALFLPVYNKGYASLSTGET
jgi:hypothetical protein